MRSRRLPPPQRNVVALLHRSYVPFQPSHGIAHSLPFSPPRSPVSVSYDPSPRSARLRQAIHRIACDFSAVLATVVAGLLPSRAVIVFFASVVAPIASCSIFSDGVPTAAAAGGLRRRRAVVESLSH